jgi:hypothetical protein
VTLVVGSSIPKFLNKVAVNILKKQGYKGYQARRPFIETKEMDELLKVVL